MPPAESHLPSAPPNLKGLRMGIGLLAALFVLTLLYRYLTAGTPSLVNTAPLMAICFGGGLLLGRRFWWVPAALLVSSDLLLAAVAGYGPGKHTLFNAALYTLAAGAGARVARAAGKPRWISLWLGTLSCSLLFYVVSNTFTWALSAEYSHTFAGWWQSQTIGLPQYSPPAWAFLRNAVIGDTLWCVLAAPLFCWERLRSAFPLGSAHGLSQPALPTAGA